MARKIEKKEFLFKDSNGDGVFRNDRVELVDLARYEFNGKEATVIGRDPKNDDRFSLRLMDGDLKLRLKSQNLVKILEPGTAVMTIEMQQSILLSIIGADKHVFDGLLGRTMVVDVLKTSTWSTVGLLKDKCAIVTCINLLRAIGQDEPEAWKSVLDLGSRLLIQGGYLLQFDETPIPDDTAWGKYGNVKAMKAYVCTNALHLQLYSQTIDSQRIVLAWRKG